jgi:apoptosis-inducing factor 3
MTDETARSAPNLKAGFSFRDIPDGGTVSGRVDDEDAILVRRGDACFAVGAHCTHYHGPLADGIVDGETV